MMLNHILDAAGIVGLKAADVIGSIKDAATEKPLVRGTLALGAGAVTASVLTALRPLVASAQVINANAALPVYITLLPFRVFAVKEEIEKGGDATEVVAREVANGASALLALPSLPLALPVKMAAYTVLTVAASAGVTYVVYVELDPNMESVLKKLFG